MLVVWAPELWAVKKNATWVLDPGPTYLVLQSLHAKNNLTHLILQGHFWPTNIWFNEWIFNFKMLHALIVHSLEQDVNLIAIMLRS